MSIYTFCRCKVAFLTFENGRCVVYKVVTKIEIIINKVPSATPPTPSLSPCSSKACYFALNLEAKFSGLLEGISAVSPILFGPEISVRLGIRR